MSVALIKARDWESESKIKRLVGDLSHHHLNSEYLNGLRNSVPGGPLSPPPLKDENPWCRRAEAGEAWCGSYLPRKNS